MPAERVAMRRVREILRLTFASRMSGREIARRLGLAPAAGWIEEGSDGLTVHLARSKTDQTGEGDAIGVPYGSCPETCPVGAYKTWVQRSGITAGPAFRAVTRHGRMSGKAITDKTVARVVKRAIIAAAVAEGLTSDEAKARAAAFAAHSLRAGLATSAAMNDAPGHAIQRQLRHSRFDTTTRYIRAGQLFKQNAAGMAGLWRLGNEQQGAPERSCNSSLSQKGCSPISVLDDPGCLTFGDIEDRLHLRRERPLV
jgi:hypothetical protein